VSTLGQQRYQFQQQHQQSHVQPGSPAKPSSAAAAWPQQSTPHSSCHGRVHDGSNSSTSGNGSRGCCTLVHKSACRVGWWWWWRGRCRPLPAISSSLGLWRCRVWQWTGLPQQQCNCRIPDSSCSSRRVWWGRSRQQWRPQCNACKHCQPDSSSSNRNRSRRFELHTCRAQHPPHTATPHFRSSSSSSWRRWCWCWWWQCCLRRHHRVQQQPRVQQCSCCSQHCPHLNSSGAFFKSGSSTSRVPVWQSTCAVCAD